MWHPDFAPFQSPLHSLAWSLYHSAHFPRKHLPAVLSWLHKGFFSSSLQDHSYKTILNQVAALHPLVTPQVFKAKDGTALAWVSYDEREREATGDWEGKASFF